MGAREHQLGACLARLDRGPVTLGVGFDYQYTRYPYEGIASRNRDLHRVQFPVEVTWQGTNARYGLEVAPGIATSSNAIKDPFRRLSRPDAVTTGRLLRYSSGAGPVSWVLGVAHDRRFGDPVTYPLAGVVLRRDSAVTWHLVLPEPSVQWQIRQRTVVSLAAFPAGSTWHVYADDFASTFRYRLRAFRGELTLSQQLWRSVRLDATLGWETARQHRFSASPLDPIRADADSGPIVAIGFRFGGASVPRTHYP